MSSPDPTPTTPTPTATTPARGAGVLIVLGLLLLIGGAAAYIISTTARPNLAVAGAHGGVGVGDGVRVVGGRPPMTETAFDTVLNSAQQLINQGKNAEAEAIYSHVVASHPEAQQVHIEYARFLAANKRPDESYQQYRDALRLGPVEPDVMLEAGTAASMCGRLEKAVEHYEKAQAAAPTDYRAPLFLGQVLRKLKHDDQAKAALLRSAELKPDVAAPAWATLAQMALDEGKPGVSLGYIAHARELDSRSTAYRVLNARALKRSGDATGALGLLIGLSDAQKREPGVMQVMAECYGYLQRPADAAALYAHASDEQPTEGKLAYDAAVWLERAGDKPRAAEYAKRAAILNIEGAAELAQRLGT